MVKGHSISHSIVYFHLCMEHEEGSKHVISNHVPDREHVLIFAMPKTYVNRINYLACVIVIVSDNSTHDAHTATMRWQALM